MPRFPDVSPTIAEITDSAFSGLARRIAGHRGELYPLHVGDTWLEPAVGARMEDLRATDHPGLHRYAPVEGRVDLIAAVRERMEQRMDLEMDPARFLITTGATGALGAIVGALVDPGDEVIVLAPHWPLITGIVRSFRAVPVPVPFFGAADSAAAAVELCHRNLSRRTVAVYWNSPNNPTGRMLPRPWLQALVDWCRQHEVWILSDEVYEDYAYRREHAYTLPLAPERTFSVHSFSKAFGMAGNRCGYAVGPPSLMAEVRKISTHTFYSAPTASQIAAARVLGRRGDAWIESARRAYEQVGTDSAHRLGVPAPEGGTFLFLDVGRCLDDRGLGGFLERCLDRGLLLAPGPSFGPYATSVRLCFTSAPPEVTLRGVEVLARLIR